MAEAEAEAELIRLRSLRVGAGAGAGDAHRPAQGMRGGIGQRLRGVEGLPWRQRLLPGGSERAA